MSDIGTDPFTIADILGHRDLNVTKRYSHFLESNRRRAVADLARYMKKANVDPRKELPQ